jgi:hypothetical protein
MARKVQSFAGRSYGLAPFMHDFHGFGYLSGLRGAGAYPPVAERGAIRPAVN